MLSKLELTLVGKTIEQRFEKMEIAMNYVCRYHKELYTHISWALCKLALKTAEIES